MVTDQLAELLRSALREVLGDGPPEPEFERPRKPEHGDWATNVALVAAKGRGNPRAIAESVVAAIPQSPLIDRVDVAGPGFINIHLSAAWLHDEVRRAADPSSDFGRSTIGNGLKINVEYVSANPTGPINVVSGRHAAVGDTIAGLLAHAGFEVTREFYVNDAGRQMDLFARSLAARYLQRFGIEAEIPEDGYRGDYMADLAAEIADEVGDGLVEASDDERVAHMRKVGLERMLAAMRASLEAFGTRYDVWRLESSLHEAERVSQGIDMLKQKGLVEERDGALWFLTSRLGDDKDRVVVRANGEPTYLASDLGYMLDKFDRGFERCIYILGADHHGTIPRFQAAADGLGFGRERVEIVIVQMVNLRSGDEALRASKRAGSVIPLDDLVQEVGADAARYTFLTRSTDAHLDFDLDLVKSQAPENPVYYVQYAHARISSILRKAASEGIEPRAGAHLGGLVHPSEAQLMRRLVAFTETVVEAAELRAPQRVTRYVEELAGDFSAFYRDCRVVSEDADLTAARLVLCLATKRVIADALGLLGVGAPERM